MHLDTGQGSGANASGDRVVAVDRKTKVIRDAQGIREKFGVAPHLIGGLPRPRR